VFAEAARLFWSSEEQRSETAALEQTGAFWSNTASGQKRFSGVQGAAHSVEGIPCTSSVTLGCVLHGLSAPVLGVAGELHHVERIHHLHRVVKRFSGGSLEGSEAVHRDHLDPGGKPLNQLVVHGRRPG